MPLPVAVSKFFSFFSSSQSLSDPNNYHEFCRLLARLKSNYQLGELVKVENYPEVIRLIANFTVTSLQVHNPLPSVGVYSPCCLLKQNDNPFVNS